MKLKFDRQLPHDQIVVVLEVSKQRSKKFRDLHCKHTTLPEGIRIEKLKLATH
jgi:hypothetical protein